MPIDARPYADDAARAVMTRLDMSDQHEAALARGACVDGYQLWADWRAMQGLRLDSRVFFTGPHPGAIPFAVGCLLATGQAGVAQAAFLARDHRQFRRPIGAAAAAIRRALPGLARDLHLRRIEARCWREHPTAPDFLSALGFWLEAEMRGFGPQGEVEFLQYAWIAPWRGLGLRMGAAVPVAPASHTAT
jgi:hypothetical protein